MLPAPDARTWNAMDTRHIGPLEVSVIGLGCNNFGTRLDEPRSAAVIPVSQET